MTTRGAGLNAARTDPSPSGPRLTILYVGNLPPHPGGDAIVTASCLAGFAARGHRVCALAPITPEALATGEAFARAHPRLRVERYCVPLWFTARDMVYGDQEYREYTRAEGESLAATFPSLVAEEHPDLIVVGHEHKGWHVPALARAAGVPYALVVHGGTTFQALVEGATSGDLRRLAEDFENAGLVITVARHLAERLQELGLRRVRAIPNAVDLRQFSPRPPDGAVRRLLRLRHGDVVVVHASNLRAVKRPLDVVESAALALPQDPRLVYVVIGDGPTRGAMEEVCRRHGIHHRFRFVGWVEHVRVVDYLNLADVVMMPSAHEGLALVYFETQACARLLVASDIPAAREAIVNGETGLLVQKGDIAALAVTTLRAAADPELRRRIGHQARRAVEGRGIDAAVAAYETAFAEVVETSQIRPIRR
jgi:glycosyltransferase involved in cell wall biosynthesis